MNYKLKKLFKPLLAVAPTPFYGQINMPKFLERFTGGLTPQQIAAGGGLVIFINMLLRVFFIAAGLFALWNFISAGWIFMASSGDPKQIGMARDKILLSLTGLLVMVSSFVLAAIFGIILFGDPGALIQPKLILPSTTAPP